MAEPRPPHPDLERVDQGIPGIKIDLRYGSKNNFTGKQIYPQGFTAWLRPDCIRCLRNVQRDLIRQGYQIVILDAYRPAWAQKILWAVRPDANFLAPPRMGSRHTRGTSVDVTLADGAGLLVEMPSEFDALGPKADHDFSDVTPVPRKHGEILRQAMFKNGFSGVPAEWWHYDLIHWSKYPLIEEK